MFSRTVFVFSFAGLLAFGILLTPPAPACCPAPPPGIPVVNADQTVIILWDAANKTQHFIRKASFLSDAKDFGFIVPSPSQPELEESGNDAFPYLYELTKPAVKKVRRPLSLGCSAVPGLSRDGGANWCSAPPPVTVLQEKEVAGFNAVVLEAKSSAALVGWLKEHGYAYSPAVEAWAKPYIEQGWKFTALKIAKKGARAAKDVAAAALRISFKTERPLFPYREPDPKSDAKALGAPRRMLRIYFLADARYQGELTKDTPWTGQVAWADKLSAANRTKLLELLKLPARTGPATWWLTEFEDWWPYQSAPADVYFSRDRNQKTLHREPIIEYVSSGWPADISVFAIAMALALPPIARRVRRK
jgi:hypothetical protein